MNIEELQVFADNIFNFFMDVTQYHIEHNYPSLEVIRNEVFTQQNDTLLKMQRAWAIVLYRHLQISHAA